MVINYDHWLYAQFTGKRNDDYGKSCGKNWSKDGKGKGEGGTSFACVLFSLLRNAITLRYRQIECTKVQNPRHIDGNAITRILL